MPVLMISYDLNGNERPASYEQVRKMVEENAISAVKPLYSQWFVETEDDIEVWQQRMKEVTDKSDRWFIHPVTRPRKGWLGSSIWEWLNART